MNKPNLTQTFIVAAMVIFLAAVSANAAVIYSETFDGDGSTSLDPNADGATVAPTIGPDGIFWAAKGNDWLMSDGSIIGGTANNTYAGANLLPFEPEVNKVYTLSMDLDHNGIKYIALGFMRDGIYDSSKLDTGYRFPQNGGIAYIMYGSGTTDPDAIKVVGGINNDNPIDDTGVYTADEVSLSIILDTTGDGSSFAADFLIDGVSITGGPQTVAVAISNIHYVGIGAYGTRSGSADGSTVDNFLLVEGVYNETSPDVYAGVDMISWSGEPVLLDATVVNNSDPVTDLTYAWTADADSLADANLTITITDADQEDATVTVTKSADTGDATVVTLTLAANNVDSGNDDVIDTLTIDVYDDACKAKFGAGYGTAFDATDINQDCITNIEDLADLAAAWLVDYSLTEPVVR